MYWESETLTGMILSPNLEYKEYLRAWSVSLSDFCPNVEMESKVKKDTKIILKGDLWFIGKQFRF